MLTLGNNVFFCPEAPLTCILTYVGASFSNTCLLSFLSRQMMRKKCHVLIPYLRDFCARVKQLASIQNQGKYQGRGNLKGGVNFLMTVKEAIMTIIRTTKGLEGKDKSFRNFECFLESFFPKNTQFLRLLFQGKNHFYC